MKALEQFYLAQEEPNRSIFLALRDCILSLDAEVSEEWKYKLPFFYYKGKMFCYLWKDKKTNEPYIGIVRGEAVVHPLLIQGNRKRMKIFPVNPNEDIPVKIIKEILIQVQSVYK